MVGAEGLFAGADNICYDGIGSEGKQGLKRGMEVQKWYQWEWAKEPTRERGIDCHDCRAGLKTWWRLESMDLSPYQSSHGHNGGSCIEAVKGVRYLTFIIFLSNCINLWAHLTELLDYKSSSSCLFRWSTLKLGFFLTYLGCWFCKPQYRNLYLYHSIAFRVCSL